jgi:hypothetical protein
MLKATKPVEIKSGLGRTILRLIHMEEARRTGRGRAGDGLTAAEATEVDLIVGALDQHATVTYGFDCDGDGLADVATLEEALGVVAGGACDCRPNFMDTSRPAVRRPRR